MKRALKLPDYRDPKPFQPPPGVVDVQLDKTTNLLATPACPQTYTAAFIAGTEPKETCEQGTGDHRNLLQKLFGLGQPSAVPPPPPAPASKPQNGRRTVVATAPQAQPAPSYPQDQDAPKKKGFFGKILGVFKGDSDNQQQPAKQGR
jgi:penicillin-binding protein 1B